MLEKLATHEVESVTMLFSLANKCARATEGRAWHSAPQDGPPKLEALVPPSREVAKRRRTRTAVVKGRKLVPRSLQQRLGARTRAANSRNHKVATVAHALSTQMSTTVPLTAARSRSSRSASADDVSRAPRMALLHLLASGLARRWPPAATRLPPRRSWGTNPQLVS